MNERGFSKATARDSLHISRMIKLPNDSVLATIMVTFDENLRYDKEFVVVFNDLNVF